MIIAINLSNLIPTAGNNFFYTFFSKLAISKPEHQFVFITSVDRGKNRSNTKNIIQIVSSPRMNNTFFWKIWLNYTLPNIARKHKADLIIHTGNVCSLRTQLPQFIFISDLSFSQFPAFFKPQQERFLKKNFKAFLEKAVGILTASDFLTRDLIERFAVDTNKISRFKITQADDFEPANWYEKDLIKSKYAEEKEFFLFTGEIHPRNNLVNLLKAFTFFKTRQKSNMQLIIISSSVSDDDPFLDIFNTYKYRKEVKILLDLPVTEVAKITAAAYAFIYPTLYEAMPIYALQAMQCDVPVVTSNVGAMAEMTRNASLKTDPSNFEDIAQKMMLIFKDETLRSKLITNGQPIMEQMLVENPKEQWWKIIEQAQY
jgi:glycosyltransferase involved in cell wall biosynthesis